MLGSCTVPREGRHLPPLCTQLSDLTVLDCALAQPDEVLSTVQGVVFNEMRSKTKVIQEPITSMDPKEFPDWSFDGSSTGQAEGNNSDCILK